MSAAFRADLAGLVRLVESSRHEQEREANAQERQRLQRAAAIAADRQAVLDTLAAADRHMTSTEIAKRAGVSRQRTDSLLDQLVTEKLANRRRRPVRRADGEGIRNPYKYRIST